MADRDFADEEVKGFERLFPTRLSKILAVAVPAPITGSLTLLRDHMAWVGLASQSEGVKTLICIAVGLTGSLLVALVLALELALVIRSAKHRRIVHFGGAPEAFGFKKAWHFLHPWQRALLVGAVPLLIAGGRLLR